MSDQPLDIAEYVDRMAEVIGLSLAPEHRPGVVDNMVRNHQIAQLVLDFSLPDGIEAAPIFQP